MLNSTSAHKKHTVQQIFYTTKAKYQYFLNARLKDM